MSSKNFAVKHGLTVGDNEIITSAGDVNVIGTIKINGNTGTNGQILQTTGTGLAWIDAPEGGGGPSSSTTISDTAPSTPSQGDMWVDSTTGILYVFTMLGGSGQWMQPRVGYAGSSQITVMDYGLVTEAVTSTQDYGILV